MARLLADLPLAECEAIVPELIGSFSAVVHRGDEVLLAVDRQRSYPLFFSTSGVVGDDASLLEDGQSLDEVAVASFLRSGYTIGGRTLLAGTNQVVAGTTVRVGSAGAASARVYDRLANTYDLRDEGADALADRHLDVAMRSIARLVESVGGRQIAVPLSGGYDSRFVVAMLKRHGYDNVTLYTYGREDSHETAIAREVAKTIGYPWTFVDYDHRRLRDFVESTDWVSYCRSGGRGASLPHIQDPAALLELRNRSVLAPDAVIVPGFSGDVLGGTFVPAEIQTGTRRAFGSSELADELQRRFLGLGNQLSGPQTRALREDLESEILSWGEWQLDGEGYTSALEAWVLRHRLSRFVVNAVRAFEFVGYEWRMPLWDVELFDFWRAVPLEQRFKSRYLYEKLLMQQFFEPAGIAHQKRHRWLLRGEVGLIRRRLPPKVKQPLKRSYYALSRMRSGERAMDVNGLEAIIPWFDRGTTGSLGVVGATLPSSSINAAEARWYIEALRVGLLNVA